MARDRLTLAELPDPTGVSLRWRGYAIAVVAGTVVLNPGDDTLRTLHQAYLRACSQVGDSRPVPLESFAKSV
ncbi:MAG: hypothetical protein AAF654_12540 [Myxococcota bacterium]